MAKRRFGIRKVIVNVWSGFPYLNFENIQLNPLKREYDSMDKLDYLILSNYSRMHL